MLLVIPKRALNVPYARWSVAAMFIAGGTLAIGLGDQPRQPMSTLMALGVVTLLSVAYALSTTFYLGVRGDELRVVTIYKRSSLALARCSFWSACVGRGRRRTWVLTVSDGSVKRKLRTYLFNTVAELAVRRLEKHLLPFDGRE